MKLKYYLRGAGIALILAVLLTNVSHRNEVSASDNTIQDYAAVEEKQKDTDISDDEKLMEDTTTEQEVTQLEDNAVDSDIVAESESVQNNNLNDVSDFVENTLGNQESVEKDVDVSVSSDFTTEEGLLEQIKKEENQIPSVDKNVETDSIVTTITVEEGAQEAYLLNVVGGDDSGTVSRKLYNAGLVDSASEFDAFLMQHGYDKKIRVGTVEIPFGATWLEIAEKLAGK